MQNENVQNGSRQDRSKESSRKFSEALKNFNDLSRQDEFNLYELISSENERDEFMERYKQKYDLKYKPENALLDIRRRIFIAADPLKREIQPSGLTNFRMGDAVADRSRESQLRQADKSKIDRSITNESAPIKNLTPQALLINKAAHGKVADSFKTKVNRNIHSKVKTEQRQGHILRDTTGGAGYINYASPNSGKYKK
jgi:hypothetical protein